jgi:sialate O-acetylesterase
LALTGTEQELQDYIREFESKYRKLEPELIAFPRGVNGVDKYTDRASIYKQATPMHVRGALLYNFYLKEKQIDKKYELTSLKDTIKLNGDWKYKLGVIATSLPSETFIRWKPLGLYNAMIAPLTNYGIKGFLWYQGEANTSNPSNYSALMQTLITDWRAKWNNVNLPFLYVQLPNFMEPNKKPVESNWAELRQQQFNLMKMPNTGMAVAIDLGDWNDIHPENKLDVAHRLALLAQKNIYNEKNLVAQGPLLKSMKVNNSKCELSFSEIGSGLVIKGGPALSQFQIAGADKIFKWAKAEIKNNQVVVWV